MGSMQSKDHSNTSDIELLELDTSENNSTMRRCSTFTDIYYQVSTARARFLYNGNRPKPIKECTCQNYDPVYVLWKNGFENTHLRAPRKVPPIKGKNRRIYDITGVLAGQQTPKGFPYYTINKKCMSYNEDFSDYEDISSKKPLLGASSTSIIPDTVANKDHEAVPYEVRSSQEPLLGAPTTSIVSDTNTNKSQQAVLSNINNEVQKEICMKDIPKGIHEDRSHGIQASFVCKMPMEQPMIIQNLLVDQKQQSAEKASVANKMHIALKKQPKRLIFKNHQRSSSNWESTVHQRHFIDIHDLGGCYYIF